MENIRKVECILRMEKAMEVIKNIEGSKAILQVVGRVDTVTSSAFQAQALEVFNSPIEKLTLDCQRLEYISSAGLRALLVIAKLAGSRQVTVALTHINALVLEVLEMSGFDSFFTIQED